MSDGEDPVASVVAGFIVWLAEQRYEQDYRHRCAVAAERFLRWQTRRRRQELPSDLNAYCRERAIDGSYSEQLNDIRRTIGELDKYLRVIG
jgi:hypothetical protein